MKGRYVSRDLDPIVVSAFPEVMPLVGSDVPTKVTGWFQGGRLRRVRADYPNGWRVQFSLSEKGVLSRVGASLRLSVLGAS